MTYFVDIFVTDKRKLRCVIFAEINFEAISDMKDKFWYLQDVLELEELENLESNLKKLECSQLVVTQKYLFLNKFRMSQHFPFLVKRYSLLFTKRKTTWVPHST